MERLIDADALCRVLNDHWLATSPSDRDTEEVAAERAAMCRGLDYAMRIVEQMPTIGGWISVKDRLPEAAGYECLVCAANENTNQTHVFTAHTGYGEPGWWTSNAHYMSRAKSPSDNSLHPALRVTHWMPLPEPPEEVKCDG